MADAKKPRAERLQFILPGDEVVAVDDFRFENRMPSRAAAVRELLKRALAADAMTESVH
jgi:hypothetical protein